MNKLIATAVIAAAMTFLMAGCQTQPSARTKISQSSPTPTESPAVKCHEQYMKFHKSKEIILE